MKRLIRTVLLTALLALSLTIGGAASVNAASASCSSSTNPLACACSAGSGSTSTACTAGTKDPISGPNGALAKVSLVISTITGVAAVIVIIVGGIQYVTSSGDAQQTASARNMIIGALVGLVIIAAAQAIITFVVSKL